MIIDCHAHAWDYWPYEPEVPDPENRGRAEMLLHEMDLAGVDKAVLVCARIDHNPNNNDYGAECVRKYPDRFIQFADVDCSWSDTYHIPGGADRLAESVEKYRLKGFTHYLKGDTDWFESREGLAFFEKAAELNQIASLALGPAWMPALRKLARRFPDTPFLCHHMAGAKVGEPPPRPMLEEILASADVPNIHIKLSGFQYVSETAWEYPYSDCMWIVRKLYEYYGADRLCWASNYPPVARASTYQHSLEAVRIHCTFIAKADMDLVLGGNMARLLAAAG